MLYFVLLPQQLSAIPRKYDILKNIHEKPLPDITKCNALFYIYILVHVSPTLKSILRKEKEI